MPFVAILALLVVVHLAIMTSGLRAAHRARLRPSFWGMVGANAGILAAVVTAVATVDWGELVSNPWVTRSVVICRVCGGAIAVFWLLSLGLALRARERLHLQAWGVPEAGKDTQPVSEDVASTGKQARGGAPGE